MRCSLEQREGHRADPEIDVALPAAVRLNYDTLPRERAVEVLQAAAGMRTMVGPVIVTGPSEADGRFWVQLEALGRAFLRPGVDTALLQTPQSPERIAVVGSGGIQVDAGFRIASVAGVLTRSGGNFVLAESTGVVTEPEAGAVAALSPVRAADENETTVASLRLRRDDDAGTGALLPPRDLMASKLSRAIEGPLRMPHVLVVSAVADARVLLGGFVSAHESYTVASTPSGTTLVLVDGRKVPHLEALELGSEAKIFVSPEGKQSPLFDSLPWFATLEAQGVTVVFAEFAAHHEYGRRVRQAEYVGRAIDELQSQGRQVVVLGEFGAPEFNDGWVDVTGTVRGTPAGGDEVLFATADVMVATAELVNLTETVAGGEGQRYTHVVHGIAQALTHGLVSRELADSARVSYGIARVGADFRYGLGMDAERGEGVSRQDAPVVYLRGIRE